MIACMLYLIIRMKVRMIVLIVKSAYTKLILVNVGQRILLLLKDKIRICGKMHIPKNMKPHNSVAST